MLTQSRTNTTSSKGLKNQRLLSVTNLCVVKKTATIVLVRYIRTCLKLNATNKKEGTVEHYCTGWYVNVLDGGDDKLCTSMCFSYITTYILLLNCILYITISLLSVFTIEAGNIYYFF